MAKVYFIGAGPGDPDLITVKGKRLIDNADIIIYAGSLVNRDVLRDAKTTEIYDSAVMTLQEITTIEIESVKNNKNVARVHTGDPSIFGAIREQMDILEEHGIEYEVIPGVSSFVAAAAAIKKEFTLPDVSQTIICTRLEGRTPVPKNEQLSTLAKHKASMAIFLSVHMIEDVVKELLEHYDISTPCTIVQRASWPDQLIVAGTLEDISEKVKKAGITKTAQILVGDFMGDKYSKSKLYDENFTHDYRKGKE